MSIQDKIIEAKKKQESLAEETKDQDKEHSSIEVDKIQEMQSQIIDLKDALLRHVADNENTKKRFQKQIQEAGDYAIMAFAKDMVEVFENFHRATSMAIATEDQSISSIVDGIEMIKKIMGDSLMKHGIERISPLDEIFNHEYHQAIKQLNDPTKPNNAVLEVVQAGYKLKNRLIKPAMVCVNIIEVN